MTKKGKQIKEFSDEDALFEMASFGTKTTGLPMIVWVTEKKPLHTAWIKVARNYNQRILIEDTFTVLISDEPKVIAGDEGEITTVDLKKIFDWVNLNKGYLLKYWNHEITTGELIDNIEKI